VYKTLLNDLLLFLNFQQRPLQIPSPEMQHRMKLARALSCDLTEPHQQALKNSRLSHCFLYLLKIYFTLLKMQNFTHKIIIKSYN
jgi:hypothetical protein